MRKIQFKNCFAACIWNIRCYQTTVTISGVLHVTPGHLLSNQLFRLKKKQYKNTPPWKNIYFSLNSITLQRFRNSNTASFRNFSKNSVRKTCMDCFRNACGSSFRNSPKKSLRNSQKVSFRNFPWISSDISPMFCSEIPRAILFKDSFRKPSIGFLSYSSVPNLRKSSRYFRNSSNDFM